MHGYFTHAETDVGFYYDVCDGDSVLAPPPHGGQNMVYNHKIYLNNEVHGSGWRHAIVRRHVAYVVVDEVEYDGRTMWVTEKWPIKRHRLL